MKIKLINTSNLVLLFPIKEQVIRNMVRFRSHRLNMHVKCMGRQTYFSESLCEIDASRCWYWSAHFCNKPKIKKENSLIKIRTFLQQMENLTLTCAEKKWDGRLGARKGRRTRLTSPQLSSPCRYTAWISSSCSRRVHPVPLKFVKYQKRLAAILVWTFNAYSAKLTSHILSAYDAWSEWSAPLWLWPWPWKCEWWWLGRPCPGCADPVMAFWFWRVCVCCRFVVCIRRSS